MNFFFFLREGRCIVTVRLIVVSTLGLVHHIRSTRPGRSSVRTMVAAADHAVGHVLGRARPARVVTMFSRRLRSEN